MDHVDRLEAEVAEGDVHGLRDGGRIGPLELEPSALPRPHHEQIELGALVGGPEIALLGPGVERPHHLLQGESLERGPDLWMCLESSGARNVEQSVEQAGIGDVDFGCPHHALADVLAPGR